ncbi:MAG: DUF6241 domain-containing protein [Clostridium sp.]
MKNFKLKAIIIAVLLICALIGGTVYITITNKVKKENALKIEQLQKEEAEKAANDKLIADKKAKEEADAKAKRDAKLAADGLNTTVVNEERVYIKMHGMINTKIKAEDGNVWGEIPITTEDCDKLIEIINTNKYEDSEKLLAFLNNWKNSNFSNGVEEHNYLWQKLGGVEGKAISLK